MKKTFFACALALAMLAMSSAKANDCCYGPQFDPCCGYVGDFDGFYIGGNVGVISHSAHRNDFDGFHTDNAGWTQIETDVEAGVQIGYDWQCCNKLFGLVFDWNWANIDRTRRDNPNAIGVENNNRNQVDWFSTLRARAGLTVCDALVYVTLGGAWARFESRWSRIGDSFTNRRSRCGWVAGAGTEFICWCNFSIGLEVLYLQFAEDERTFTTTTGANFRFGHSDSLWVGRILFNYRFGDLFGCCGV